MATQQEVEQAYQSQLGRAPDAGGLAYWMAQGDLSGFQNAAQSEVANRSVADVYQNILGRAPDAGGLAYWSNQFGPTVDANELAQFRVAAQPELSQQPTYSAPAQPAYSVPVQPAGPVYVPPVLASLPAGYVGGYQPNGSKFLGDNVMPTDYRNDYLPALQANSSNAIAKATEWVKAQNRLNGYADDPNSGPLAILASGDGNAMQYATSLLNANGANLSTTADYGSWGIRGDYTGLRMPGMSALKPTQGFNANTLFKNTASPLAAASSPIYPGSTYSSIDEQVQKPAPGTVAAMYQDVLGRAGDTKGLSYWQNLFGPTVDSSELAQFTQAARPEQFRSNPTVANLYQAALGRAGDAPGLAYWESKFGPTVDAGELAQFTQAAQPEKLGLTPWVGEQPLGGQLGGGYDFSGWEAKDINKYAPVANPDFDASRLIPDGNGGYLKDENGAYATNDGSIFAGGTPTMSLTYQGSEGDRYQNAGRNDPRWLWAVQNAAKTPDKFDDYIAAHPDALGWLNDRAFRPGDDSQAFQGSGANAFWADRIKAAGLGDQVKLNPNQQASGDKWANYMTADAQDARAPKPSSGPLMTIAAAIAAAYGMPYLMEMAGLGAGAGLGATASELAIDAGALGGAGSGFLGGTTSMAELGSLAGQGGLFGNGGILGTGMDTGSSLANSLGEKFATNTITSGGDLERAATNTALGAGMGLAGGALLSNLPSGVTAAAAELAPAAQAASKVAGAVNMGEKLTAIKPTAPMAAQDSAPAPALVKGINSMYSTALGRSPTDQELAHWNSLAKQGFSAQDIVNEFKKTPEFVQKYTRK